MASHTSAIASARASTPFLRRREQELSRRVQRIQLKPTAEAYEAARGGSTTPRAAAGGGANADADAERRNPPSGGRRPASQHRARVVNGVIVPARVCPCGFVMGGVGSAFSAPLPPPPSLAPRTLLAQFAEV